MASIREGAFNREGRLTQNSIQRGASIRYGAFIRSFTVSSIFLSQNVQTLTVFSQSMFLASEILTF